MCMMHTRFFLTGLTIASLLLPTVGYGMHNDYNDDYNDRYYDDYYDDYNRYDDRDYDIFNGRYFDNDDRYDDYDDYNDDNDFFRRNGSVADYEEELDAIRDALCWPRTTRECDRFLDMERDYLERIQEFIDEGFFRRSDERRELEDFLEELQDEGLVHFISADEGETFSINVYGGRKNDEFWSVSYDNDYLTLERTTGGYSWWRNMNPSSQAFTFRARQEGNTAVSFRTVRASGGRSSSPLSRVYLVRIED